MGAGELFTNVALTLAARGYGYDPAFLVCAYVGDALFGSEPPACLEKLYRANTTLLPEAWMDRVSLEDVADRVRKDIWPDRSMYKDRDADWEARLDAALSDYDDDKLVTAVFPPRSPQDIGIRYIRAADLWSYILRVSPQCS